MSPVSDSSTNGVKVTSGALNDRVTVFIASVASKFKLFCKVFALFEFALSN